jgi:translocator protein
MLYGAMGYASYRATVAGLSSPSSTIRHLAHNSQGIYTMQLVTNLVWMPLFFGCRRPLAAFVDMLVLAGTVAGLANNYRQVDSVAFYLLLPYLGWLGFASYLNFGVGYLNGWDISDEKIGRSTKKE